jgi:hypothetical protein
MIDERQWWRQKVDCQFRFNSKTGRRLLSRPHGSVTDYAQENPGLVEQPDRAPEGTDDRPEEILKLEEEMVFFTFLLPHLLQTGISALDCEVVRTSKIFLQSSHLYSYIGIIFPSQGFDIFLQVFNLLLN